MDARPRRQWSPVLIPVIVAALFAVFGQPVRAGTVALLAAIAALLILLGVPLAPLVERGAKALGHGLSTVAGTAVFLVVIGPAWTWTRITRRDPFARTATPRWADHSISPPEHGSLGSPTHLTVGRRSFFGRLTWGVGCVILLLAANYLLGWAWDSLKDEPKLDSVDLSAQADATETEALPEDTLDAASVEALPVSSTKYDPRADLPAMQAYPWRDQYFQDIQRAPSIYWPYTQYRPMPFRSPYLNIDGWTRRTYRTPGSTEGRPLVWMFGGSTTWGEGQRDEFTIASWLVRLAEQDGIPIEARNFGQRGWTHFQGMVLYEQQLALQGAPDVSLFYDGVNELNTQALVPEPVPSHYDVTDEGAEFDGKAFATRFSDGPDLKSLAEDLQYAYSEHSLLHKIVRYASSPAGADPARPTTATDQDETAQDDGGQSGSGEEESSEDSDVVRGSEFDVTDQDGADAGEVYQRAQVLTQALSNEYGVPSLFYWQPFKSINVQEEAAQAELEPPTIDISDLLLDHQDVYIDGAHTTEEGSRIVAERLWEDLEPLIREWYEANP
jgi:hypothetical protein